MCNLSLVSTKKKNKYIYQSYYKDYYNNNNPYIGNLFLPVLCVSGRWACLAGSRGLLKLSQVGRCWNPVRSWQAGRSWMVSEARRCWGIFCRKNNGRTAMATFDNSYRKCYNKCNDDNKNVICHQTVKFAL